MEFRYSDDLGPDGFSWIAEEPMTRTAHALAADGRVWLVDPVDWPDAIDRALALGLPTGVLQLLDRHNRDCATLADRLGVPHLIAPDEVPGSPFECIAVKRMKRYREFSSDCRSPAARSQERAPASKPGRTSRGGATRPASFTGGFSGSVSGATPNDACTRSSAGSP